MTGLSVDPTQSVDGQNPALVAILKQNTTCTMGYSLTTLLPELHTFQEVSHFSKFSKLTKLGTFIFEACHFLKHWWVSPIILGARFKPNKKHFTSPLVGTTQFTGSGASEWKGGHSFQCLGLVMVAGYPVTLISDISHIPQKNVNGVSEPWFL